LTSFGAVDIRIQDAAGNAFNLAAGKKAIVRIPVDPAQLLALAAHQRPFRSGFTMRLRIMDRAGDSETCWPTFTKEVVDTFGFNVDVAKVDAACMRLFWIKPNCCYIQSAHHDPGRNCLGQGRQKTGRPSASSAPAGLKPITLEPSFHR